MIKRGVYAASLSVLNKDLTLNVKATIFHGEHLIKKVAQVFFSLGQREQVSYFLCKKKKNLSQKLLAIN